MKPFASLAAALALVAGSALPAAAHPEGHDLPVITIEKASAETRAKNVVMTMIDRNAVEASWATVKPTSAQLRMGRDGIEWMVQFDNPKVRDPAKRKLFVFLTSDGSYLATNHTGQ